MTPRKPRGPNKGSFTEAMFNLKVGQALWLETPQQGYRAIQHQATTWARYPALMRHMRFACAVYTCVGCAVGDVRYTVRIERIE